ncbi:hypothetical protein [Embleya sp. NPDC020886]|uniref:hypothetical protein n=1 Tax=Embleya sp. NPDC020886 TaxID=3363980 RepID=UPI003799C938
MADFPQREVSGDDFDYFRDHPEAWIRDGRSGLRGRYEYAGECVVVARTFGGLRFRVRPSDVEILHPEAVASAVFTPLVEPPNSARSQLSIGMPDTLAPSNGRGDLPFKRQRPGFSIGAVSPAAVSIYPP